MERRCGGGGYSRVARSECTKASNVVATRFAGPVVTPPSSALVMSDALQESAVAFASSDSWFATRDPWREWPGGGAEASQVTLPLRRMPSRFAVRHFATAGGHFAVVADDFARAAGRFADAASDFAFTGDHFAFAGKRCDRIRNSRNRSPLRRVYQGVMNPYGRPK
jgi:hypothetical protein